MNRGLIFWIGLGAAGLAIAITGLVTNSSIKRRQQQADSKLNAADNDQLKQLRPLLVEHSLASRIPTDEKLAEMQAYSEWSTRQANEIREDYVSRSNEALNSLLKGESDPTPSQFKSVYIRDVDELKKVLANGNKVQISEKAFAVYEWVVHETLPRPEIFQKVRRDFWIRSYVLTKAINNEATELISVTVGDELGKDRVLPSILHGDLAGRIPVTMTVVLPPNKTEQFLQSLLEVPKRQEDQPYRGLFILPTKLIIEKRDQVVTATRMVTPAALVVTLSFDVLNYRAE
jgi:hypothetical protein